MVSTAAGLARHGLLPVVNSFAAFLASRANEQIYNQASEGTKVVYALHYAGLIPAGPGQVAPVAPRHLRCSAALPEHDDRPARERRARRGALLRWAVEEPRRTSRSGSRSARRRGGSSFPRRRASTPGRGTRRSARATTRSCFAYGPVMLHEALTAAELLAERGRRPRGRGHAVAQPRSTRTGSQRDRGRSTTSSCSRTTRRSAASATRCVASSTAARSRCSASRAGPRAERRRRRSASTASTAHRSPSASRARSVPETRVTREPVWLVLPDPFSTRRLLRLRDRRRLARAAPAAARGRARPAARARRPTWAPRARRRAVDLGDDFSHRGRRHAERVAPPHRRRARPAASATTRSAIRLQPAARLPPRADAARATRTGSSTPTLRRAAAALGAARRALMRGWHFCTRRLRADDAPRAHARESARALVVANVQTQLGGAVPRRPRAGSGCRSSATSRAGTTRSARGSISPHCDRYVVQNDVMRDDLVRYHGIGRSGSRSRAGRRPTSSTRRRPREEYERGRSRARPRSRPAARARRGEHADERALRGPLRRAARRAGGARAAPTPASSSCSGRIRATASGRSGSRRRSRVPGARGAGAELHGPRDARDPAPARRLRRRERGHDPARRLVNDRPAVCVLYDEGAPAGESSGAEERHRRALRGARGARTPSTAPSGSRRSSPGSSARSRDPDELAAERARVAREVVGEVDGRAAERVVDAIVDVGTLVDVRRRTAGA